MTKARWQVVSRMEEIPMDVWYEYYQEMKGTLSIERFERVFPQMLGQEVVIEGAKGHKLLSFNTAINRLYQHYDNKY